MNKNTIISLAALALTATAAGQAQAQTDGRHTPAPEWHGPTLLHDISGGNPAGDTRTLRTLSAKNATRTTTADAFKGRKFYGSLINSTDWASTSITQVPYGIYSFEIGDNIAPKAEMTGLSYNFISGAYTGGQFFGIYAMEVMGGLNGARYITLDTDNWTELRNVAHDATEHSYSLLASTMSYNYIDNTVYTMQYNDALSGLDWSKYTPEYDAIDKIATFRGKYNVLAMATTPDGEMYFINAYGDLYHVDKTNGRPALIAWTGVTPALYSQTMMYDNRTGLFLWAAVTGNANVLYAVDPETAATERIAAFKKSEQFTALYTTANEARDGAPAIVDGLQLAFNRDGSTDGTLSFTMPATTYAGGPLDKALLNVWLDGKNLRGVETAAGETVSIPVVLTEGNHYIAVNTKNDEGWSPLATVKQYAGHDTPLAPTGVDFTAADGTNTVSWTAPAGGVNGGYVDAQNLRYTVVRMPDSVVVATAYAQTSYSEPTPSALHSYSYRVQATADGKAGAWAESPKVTCGDAFTTPYSQGFDSQSDFEDYFTVIDNDGDSTTWKYQEWGNIARMDLLWDSKTAADDWLVTPAVSLEGGKNYRYTINLKTYSKGYPEPVQLLVGTDPKDVNSFTPIAPVDTIELYETYTDYAKTFNIASSGKYYLALRYLGDKSKNSSMLLVKRMSVDEVGATAAPAAVSALSVTAGADDAMQATVSFRTPTTTLGDAPLTALTRVNVYRNAEKTPVHTFEAPATDAPLSWTDTQVTRVGMNAYTVKAENAEGEGAAAADSAFVGCYAAPYLETFASRSAAGHYTVVMKGIDDANKDYYLWKYDENNQRMNIYAFNAQAGNTVSAWLITPLIRLDANSVYRLGYKKSFSVYTKTVGGDVYMGRETSVEGMTDLIGILEPNASYGMEDGENTAVTTEAGKYCFGFDIEATGQYDNIMADLDDISVTYVKSAFSPYAFGPFKVSPDAKGALRTTLSAKAPTADYQGTPLTDNLTVYVYRGNASLPVYTKTDVAPGTTFTWTDTDAQQGTNTYSIVAANSHGRSETSTASAYVGIDRPSQVASLAVKGNADNTSAVITWGAPAKGHNGGVVIADALTYRVMRYDATERTLTTVADDIHDRSYTVDHADLKHQEAVYYAVVAKNEAGIGDTIIAYTVLGPLYTLPYHESFADKQLQTTPWTISSQNTNVLNWGVSEPTGQAYNAATPQDGDGGCAYFYNGSYYQTYAGAGFISPKIALGGQKTALTFWVYNYPAKYDQLPYVLVYGRADDGEYEEIARYVVSTDDDTEEWKQYTVDLSRYSTSHYVNIGFYAYTAGYQECIYLDNIAIGDEATGISTPGTDASQTVRTEWYDMSGRRVAQPTHGVYLRKTVHADGTLTTDKILR